MKFVKEMIPENFPELNDMHFKVESMGSEKKIHTKANYMKFQNPKEKGTIKPARKKKKKADHIQRNKNQNNIRLLKNDTKARSI